MTGHATPMAVAPAAAFDGPRGWVAGLHYGVMGFPLAFVALPLYVLWPHHCAQTFGVPLAALGVLLLLVRLADAVVDPLIGRWVDGWGGGEVSYQKATHRFSFMGSVLLLLGFWALFFPPLNPSGGSTQAALLVWAGAALVVTYWAFSVLTVAHQAWGARLGGHAAQRSRIVAWREGWGLAGVVVASVVPTVAGLPALMAVLALGLAAGVLLWRRAVVPVVLPVESPDASPWLAPATRVAEPPSGEQRPLWAPLAQARFRHLLVVYVLNGMASAVPATLVLFFVQDRLQAPRSLEPLFLGSYFLCAAAAIPLWLRGVVRWGLARTWALGMGLSVAVFAWVLALGAGDWPAFVAVCVLSGVALGADLVLPAAMLNGLIADGGHRGRSEGAHLGWWSFATKLNLALAAGVALPLLGVLGYAPGQQSASALWALSLVYGAVPCVLKLGAWALLHWFFIRQETP